MLMYGNSSIIKILPPDTIIFNISSLKEGLQKLHLMPPRELGHFYDREFDIAYANYIFNNDNIFYQFFTIVYNLYLNNDVYLVIDISDWSENIIESICKLIQQRYGYDSIKIDTYDDYIYAVNNFTCGFNQYYGISNLDIDKERYSYLNEKSRLDNGGTPYSDSEY